MSCPAHRTRRRAGARSASCQSRPATRNRSAGAPGAMGGQRVEIERAGRCGHDGFDPIGRVEMRGDTGEAQGLERIVTAEGIERVGHVVGAEHHLDPPRRAPLAVGRGPAGGACGHVGRLAARDLVGGSTHRATPAFAALSRTPATSSAGRIDSAQACPHKTRPAMSCRAARRTISSKPWASASSPLIDMEIEAQVHARRQAQRRAPASRQGRRCDR